jgi:outer membrane receptor protein involved in Fe transport
MIASGMKPEWYENYSASLGFDLKLSRNSQLSASYFHGNRTEGRQAFYLYQIFNADREKNPIPGYPINEQWIFNPNEGIREGLFHTFNVDYTLRPNETSKFGIALLYENSVLTHDVDNPNIFYNPVTKSLGNHQLHYHQTDRTPLDGIRLLLDYSKKYENGSNLTLGLQPYFLGISGGLKYDTLNVESNVWGPYTSLENKIDLKRNIYAAFADYSGTMGKLNFKAGLRLEYTDQVMEIDNPNYFSIFDRPTESQNVVKQLDWFPSLHASYPLNATDNVSLAASRRISRSPIKNMAPFLFRRHLEVFVVGDPGLKPEYINNLEMTYSKSINNQRLTFTGFYRGVENAVFRVNTVYAEEMVLIRSFTNAGKTQSIGLELISNLDLGSKAKAFVGGSVYDYRVQADIFGFQEDQRSLSWSIKSNVNYMPTKPLRLSADLDIRSAQVTAQGQNELRYLVNASASYTPQKLKGWNFILRGLNLLNSNKNSLSTRAFNSEGVQIFYQDTEFYWYGPILEMGISYNFNWKGQARRTGSEFGKDEF